MITDRLKAETRKDHEDTEKLSFEDRIMDGSLTIHQYRQLMVSSYIFNQIIEQALLAYEPLGKISELQLKSRIKSEAIKADLKMLGIDADYLPNRHGLKFESLEEALGYLYVVEGATLGGSGILKALEQNPNIHPVVNAFHYYSIYKESTATQWKNFQFVLIEYIRGKHQQDQVIMAARKAFGLFREIFTQEPAILLTAGSN